MAARKAGRKAAQQATVFFGSAAVGRPSSDATLPSKLRRIVRQFDLAALCKKDRVPIKMHLGAARPIRRSTPYSSASSYRPSRTPAAGRLWWTATSTRSRRRRSAATRRRRSAAARCRGRGLRLAPGDERRCATAR